MLNSNRTNSILSLSVMLLLLVGMAGTARAQQKQQKPAAAPATSTAKPTSPSTTSPSTTPATSAPKNPPSVWAALLSLLKRQEPPLASRGRVCPILPGLLGETYVIWNRRPLFAWQGQVQSIELRPSSLDQPFDAQPILWQQTISPETQQSAYNGPPLQPGQKYDWQMVDAAGIPRRYTFAVMSTRESQQVDAALTSLLQQLQADQATPEQIAAARAKFFADRQLWSDAAQEMYLHQKASTSPDLATLEELSRYFCVGR